MSLAAPARALLSTAKPPRTSRRAWRRPRSPRRARAGPRAAPCPGRGRGPRCGGSRRCSAVTVSFGSPARARARRRALAADARRPTVAHAAVGLRSRYSISPSKPAALSGRKRRAMPVEEHAQAGVRAQRALEPPVVRAPCTKAANAASPPLLQRAPRARAPAVRRRRAVPVGARRARRPRAPAGRRPGVHAARSCSRGRRRAPGHRAAPAPPPSRPPAARAWRARARRVRRRTPAAPPCRTARATRRCARGGSARPARRR